jgi:hypothetical protein
MRPLLFCLPALLLCGCDRRDAGNNSANGAVAVAAATPEVGQKPICEAIPIGTNGSAIIECGGPPDTPDKPDKPTKPDRPDKPDKPDRSGYIAADRAWTDRSIDVIMKTPMDAAGKNRAIAGLEEHHRDCAAGRSKCVGEP